jgi:hypothetical protein
LTLPLFGGLGLPNDLQPADFLAFELGGDTDGTPNLTVLGVEFFESASSADTIARNAEIFDEPPTCVEVITYTFSDLDGDFVADGEVSGVFTAVAQSIEEGASTQGDVTRRVPPLASAVLDFGAETIGAASFIATISVENLTADTATGSGEVTFTDVDGDTVTALVSGNWMRVGTSSNFIGLLTQAFVAVGDGTFDGFDGSSFLTTFAEPQPFEGNLLSLTFQVWFTNGSGDAQDFEDATTLINGVIGIATPD